MKIFIKYVWVVISLALFFQNNAHALMCPPDAGHPYIFNFSYNLSPNQNYVGYTTQWKEQFSTAAWSPGYPCNKKETHYFSTTPGPQLTLASTEGDTNWYDIQGNDYIQVASKVTIHHQQGGPTFYYSVPFTNISNNCNEKCTGDDDSGTHVKVNFKIKKRFVGNVQSNGVVLYNLYAANYTNFSPTAMPVVQGILGFSITVPQKCALNTGQVITMDFKNIPSSSFNTAGGKAQGVNALSRSIYVYCNGIVTPANLTLRVEADSASGNAIKSDNKDVGFVITDSNNKELTPNNINSFIPFSLNSNSNSNVTIKVYPVSITGNKPKEGPVTSLAFLRVDFE